MCDVLVGGGDDIDIEGHVVLDVVGGGTTLFFHRTPLLSSFWSLCFDVFA